MSAFAIFVTIKLKPGNFEEYMMHIEHDREGALRDEPGCQLFHILTPPDSKDTVYLYEVYDDEEAFDNHQKTPHFVRYVQETEELIAERIIQRLERVD
jgi:quinol monooxygenase YgiN